MNKTLKEINNIYINSDVKLDSEVESKLLTWIQEFASNLDNQVNILVKPLSTNQINIDSEAGIIIAIPNHKIIILNLQSNNEVFEEYYEDIISSIDFINKRYDYERKLGKVRKWGQELLCRVDNIDMLKDIAEYEVPKLIDEKNGKRFVNYVISLLIGSHVPSENVVLEETQDLLQAIKNKIVIYDTKQKEFLHDDFEQKIITIQGLAGTGKTELLIQKIKDIYLNEDNAIIAMTCYNHVLADSLKKRIPELFDAYKVDKQIEWNKRLFVMRSWGSSMTPNTGFYSYICHNYKIPFYRYSYSMSFDTACKLALQELQKIQKFEPIFDYTFIDESQDFSKSFFELAEFVTKKRIIFAGDIFQNVFDNMSESFIKPNIILRNCYRTNPKNLMFSHLLSMGMLENRSIPLRWLNDTEWNYCGYNIERINNSKIKVNREPIKRFDEDIEDDPDFLVIKKQNPNSVVSMTIKTIQDIQKKYPDVKPEDIAIIFLENQDENYKMFNNLEVEINSVLNIEVNKAYITKYNKENTIFLSNRNNIKGLEFPFIICISSKKMSDSKSYRNSLYMVLTRAFITAYLLISDENDGELIENLNLEIKKLQKTDDIIIDEPSIEVKSYLEKQVISPVNLIKSKKEIVEEIMRSKSVSQRSKSKIHKILESILSEDADIDKIERAVSQAIDLIEKL